MDIVSSIDQRRRNLRIVLFIIIIATLPFYCAGILLWGTSPARNVQTTLGAPTSTLPPSTRATNTAVGAPSVTPIGFVTATRLQPLLPTPGQFFPPAVTRFLSPTAPLFPPTETSPFIPIPTLAPTLTQAFVPTNTSVPIPTDTTIPLPSNTPQATNTTPPIPDSDGDGVPDNLDVCPLVPAPGTIDGCPTATTPAPPTDDPGLGTPIPPGP